MLGDVELGLGGVERVGAGVVVDRAGDLKKREIAARTDAQIIRDVLHGMKEDSEVPGDRIRAKAADGRVTIEGTGTRDVQKAAAESCARRVNPQVSPAIGYGAR